MVSLTCVYTYIKQFLSFNRFEYVKPCFGQLIVPAVPDGNAWTGDRVKSLTAQGMDLYIRSRTLILPKVDTIFSYLDRSKNNYLVVHVQLC